MADIINVDDFVVIERIVRAEEGWRNKWSSNMDNFIGTIAKVTNIGHRGVILYVRSPQNENLFNINTGYYFPLSSLVLL